MKYPKIKTVKVLDEQTLLVQFDNEKLQKYNIAPLLDKPSFAPLKDFNFFKTVHVDPTGYAILWNEDIDLSEYEILTNGSNVNS